LETLKKILAPIAQTIDYIQTHFKALLFLLLVGIIVFPFTGEESDMNNLERIELSGPIVDTTEVVRALDRAAKSEHIKGVLLVVNSPGGTVPPSLEVAYAVKRLQNEKPVVVYAKGLLASGGYYASIWAKEIIANPGAMVGSIGVIMQGADMQGLMEKVGIRSQVVKAGKYKQTGTPDRPWTPFERAELEKVIDATYAMFVHDVAEARGLDPQKSSEFADAHIFTPAQAKAVGLIDTIGVEYDAQRRVETLSGVETPLWNEEDMFTALLKQVEMEGASMLQLYFPRMELK